MMTTAKPLSTGELTQDFIKLYRSRNLRVVELELAVRMAIRSLSRDAPGAALYTLRNALDKPIVVEK
jgi:hypothetical protein